MTAHDSRIFYTRDVYSRLISLLIRRRKWQELEDYLENPPIFLLEAVPKIHATIKANKRKQALGSRVLKIRLIEVKDDPIETLKKRALKDQAKTKP